MLNVKGAATLGGASHPVAKLLVDDREVTLPAGAKSIILLNIPTVGKIEQKKREEKSEVRK